MKRTAAISKIIFGTLLLTLVSFCLSPSFSYADAPKDVTVKYDTVSQTLSVAITHKSLFPKFHHIKNVEIKKNATIVSSTNYDTQPKEVPFTYTYKVAAAPGDKLDITATCSMSGSKTASTTVADAGK